MTKFIKASEVITAIESLEKEVREEATRTKENVYKYVYLYGEDTIRLFCEKFPDIRLNYIFNIAGRHIEGLKLTGSSKFIYIAVLELSFDFRDEKEYMSLKRVEKCVECNGAILDVIGNYKDKTFSFCLYGEEYFDPSRRLCKAPQMVGTVTDKKMQAWIEYLKAEKAAQEADKNAKKEEVQSFKQELCEITGVSMELLQGREEGTIYGEMFRVSWYANERTGSCDLSIRMLWDHDMNTLRTLKEKGLLY